MEVWVSVQTWAKNLSMSDGLAIASIAIAALSFLISQGAARRQTRLQREALRTARDSDLIAWADQAIDAIAEAQGYCRDLKNNLLMGPDAARAQSALRTRLSALLDRGRLFFPNQPSSVEDGEPAWESAYSGEPHPAIAALHRVFRIITELGRLEVKPAEAVQAIVAERRTFVSEVFVSVDPRRREAALKGFARWRL